MWHGFMSYRKAGPQEGHKSDQDSWSTSPVRKVEVVHPEEEKTLGRT